MKALAPDLSARLVQSFAKAQRYQDDYAKANPGDKPPFVDGSLFCSLFEGFRTFEVGRVERMEDGRTKVAVSLSYHDPGKPKDVTRWQDAVVLTSEKGREVVDDILFLGDWPFKSGERLSQVLEARD